MALAFTFQFLTRLLSSDHALSLVFYCAITIIKKPDLLNRRFYFD